MRIIEIDDINLDELQVYSSFSENQLAHYYEPQPGLFIGESPIVIERALNDGYEPLSFLVEAGKFDEYTTGITSGYDVPVYTAREEVLLNITGFKLTRGMLCCLRRKELPSFEEVCNGARRIAILENVVNPTNIGAIFRSAAALNVDAVLLTPACCDPLYRRSIRVSMGTVFQIPWTYICQNTTDWPHPYIDRIKALGFKTTAMALTDNSVSINDPQVVNQEQLAIILGTEGQGLMPETIASCDYTVKIPMSHDVDSLNVAAASAVAFWALCN